MGRFLFAGNVRLNHRRWFTKSQEALLDASGAQKVAAMDGQMVIDVASEYYRNDINFLLSELTHELFHVGYGQITNGFQENPLEDETRYSYFSQLQNEGIATYV